MREPRLVLAAQRRIDPQEMGPLILLEARRDRLRLITPSPGAQAAILFFTVAALLVPFAGGAALFLSLGLSDPLLFVEVTAGLGAVLGAILLALRPWTPEFLARHPEVVEDLRVLEVWDGARRGTQELHVEGEERDFWIIVPGTRARVTEAVKLSGQVPVYVEGPPHRSPPG